MYKKTTRPPHNQSAGKPTGLHCLPTPLTPQQNHLTPWLEWPTHAHNLHPQLCTGQLMTIAAVHPVLNAGSLTPCANSEMCLMCIILHTFKMCQTGISWIRLQELTWAVSVAVCSCTLTIDSIRSGIWLCPFGTLHAMNQCCNRHWHSLRWRNAAAWRPDC